MLQRSSSLGILGDDASWCEHRLPCSAGSRCSMQIIVRCGFLGRCLRREAYGLGLDVWLGLVRTRKIPPLIPRRLYALMTFGERAVHLMGDASRGKVRLQEALAQNNDHQHQVEQDQGWSRQATIRLVYCSVIEAELAPILTSIASGSRVCLTRPLSADSLAPRPAIPSKGRAGVCGTGPAS